MYQNTQFQNNPYDQLYHEAEVLAGIDHFIQEVCLGSYDLYHQNLMIDLQKLVQSFKPIYNADFSYCNTVLIFIEVVNIVDYTLSLMPQADYDSIMYFDEMAVWHILTYIQSLSGCVQQQLIDFQQRELKNQQSLFEYASTLIHHYARTLVVRVDLSIKKEYQALYNIQAFNQALEVLHRRIADQDTCFSGLHGYAWALEHGVSKGYHCHLLLMYDGNIHQEGFMMGHWIGEYWEQITHGCGYIFNCNHPEYMAIYEAMGTLGIGMIHRHDEKKINNFLNYVVLYLVNGEKEQQHLRVKKSVYMRSFGRGVANSKNRRGID
ncbi:inovirus-type Gp2 protein [Acinetobacter baumannii]|uniref:YagK/YfjJ domain-containing protein n=1 Tax=Acinetobacter baumannii TaxID=470 RepID=UPI001BA4C645|nr:inovirus-type Gp2 protein [Acinetobacter baumannii]QUD78471.1 inovirus-type Gp2 protein [Acinetobacter baumannii]